MFPEGEKAIQEITNDKFSATSNQGTATKAGTQAEGHGDAQLKNWSLLYADQITPHLSPAYDIVTTSVYIENEQRYALNLGKTNEWYKVSFEHFEVWAKRAGIPWRAIRPHLEDTMESARSLWPQALKNLPMDDGHKEKLKAHWAELHPDFRL